MFSVLSKVTSYLWRSGNEDCQETSEPVEPDDKNSQTQSSDHCTDNNTIDQGKSASAAAFKGEVRTDFGRITNILQGYGIIDYDIYFSLDTVVGGERPLIGQTVHFTAKRNADSGWRATTVTISECWDESVEPKVAKEANDKSVAQVIEENENEKSEQSIGMVTGVHGSEVIINEKLTTDIKVFKEFCPVRGDWLNFKLYTDEKTGVRTVTQVEPLRQKNLDGNITFLRQTFGIVNDEIYFLSSAISKNFLPHRNDKVRVQAIESSQGQYNWRATYIAPKSAGLHEHRNLGRPDQKPKFIFGSFVQELLRDKGGISITNPLDFGKINLNRKLFVTAWVRNCGSQPQVLVSCCTPSQQNSVFFFDDPKPVLKSGGLPLSECCEDGIRMHPGGAVYVNIRCEASILGKFKQLIVFEFKGFKIGRHMTAEVHDVNQSAILPVAPFKPRSRNDCLKSVFTSIESNSWVVPGEAPRRGPPKRIPISLPQYPVPSDFWKCIKENSELLDVIPSLAVPVNPENYANRFQALIYLEEIQTEIDMRFYDIKEAMFKQRGEYLSLEVPGLAEGRPSLLIGDKVLLSNDENQATKFEGYIHEVQNIEIFLKFHSSFHMTYDGEAYSVAFQISRTTLRREHQAVTLMQGLGQNFLFPHVLELKEPQICFQERTSSCSHCQIEDDSSRKTSTVELRPKQQIDQDLSNKAEVMNPKYYKNNMPNGLKGTYSSPEVLSSDFNEYVTEKEEEPMNFKTSDSICIPPEVKTHSILNDCEYSNETDAKLNSEANSRLPPTPPNDRSRSRTSSCSSDSHSSCRSGRSPRQTVVERLFGVKSPIHTNVPSSEEYEDEAPYKKNENPNDSPERISKKSANKISWDEEEAKFSENFSRFGISEQSLKLKPSSKTCKSEVKNINAKVRNNVTTVKCVGSSSYDSPPSFNFNSSSEMKSNVRTVTDNSFTTAFRKESMNAKFLQAFNNRSSNKMSSIKNSSPQMTHCLKKEHKKPSFDDESNSYQVNSYFDTRENLPTSEFRSEPDLSISVDQYQRNVCTSPNKKVVPSTKNKGKRGLPTSPRKSNKSFKNPGYANSFNSNVCNFVASKNNARLGYPHLSSAAASSPVYSPLKIKKEDPTNQCLCECHGHRSLRKSMILDWQNKYLNECQKAAVRRILGGMCRPVPYIIFGPPGTGKTVTVVEAIIQIYKLLPHSRILACTPSNSAADLITERLHLSGVIKKGMMIRLNSFNRIDEAIPESVRPFCEDSLDVAVASRYRIIVSTCVTAGLLYNAGVPRGHFTHVVIDEAGQATEPESLIPIMLTGMDGQVVLAGDPNQLGAIIRSTYSRSYGLDVSLLERLMQRPVYNRDETKFSDHGNYDPLLVTKLVQNYRSHPALLKVPSELFYDNELEMCASESIRELLCNWEALPCKGFPFIMHGVQGKDLREGNSPSWFNPVEVMQVINYLQSLYTLNLKPNDIGIISPYRKQVEKIRMMLNSLDIDPPKIGSVEEFQGQERIAVIISTVRSEENYLNFDSTYNLGFLKNSKRFNVAITRAQALLIIVGNPYILNQDPCWNHLIKYAVANGAYIGCDLSEIDLEPNF